MPYLGQARHGARLVPCTRAYSVVAWGRNLEGQCGVGSSRLVVTEPEEVQGLPLSSSGCGSVLSLSAAKTHSAAVLDNGEVWTWGDGTAAKLGHGTTEACARPHRVETLVGRARVKATALGRNHTMFLDEAGSVWTAGEARVGQASLGLESFATRQALAVPRVQLGGPIAEQGWVSEPAGSATRTAQPISSGGWSSGSSLSSSSSPPSGAGVWVDRQRKGNLSTALAAAAAQQQSAYSAHLVPFVDHSGRATELAAAQGLYDSAFEAWLGPRSTATRYESDSPLGITTAGYPLGQTGHPFRLPADSFFDGQRIVDVAASRHRTWVVTADGRVWALGGDWGRPDKATALEAALARGWLAPAVPLAADVARAVAAEGGARKVVAGGGFAALLTASGEVIVWGAHDVIAGGSGIAVAGSHEPEAWQTPGVQALLPHARTWRSPHEAGIVIIPRGLASIVDIAAGWSHLALTDGRKVWTLGRPVGAMRDSTSTTVPSADDWLEPRESFDLGPDKGIDTLAAGGGATAAIGDDGSLTMLGVLLTQAGAEALAHAARQGDATMPSAEATWGPGFVGMGSQGEAVRVTGLGRVRAIALGPQHALAEVED